LPRNGTIAAMNRSNGDRDVREELTSDFHTNEKAAPKTSVDAPVEIRLARADDAEGLSRCFYGAYGDSYDHTWVYKPDALRRRWSERKMVSVVGLAPDGEVIGHLAATFTGANAKVAEAGQAVVNPRYRGHHLFESMKKWLAAWAGREALYGLFSEATTAHPYSQRGNLALGAHEMGFLFGYIPSSVDYKQITEGAAPQRKAAALMYLRTNREPERLVHLPPEHRQIAMRIYENAGFARVAGADEGTSRDAVSEVHVKRDDEHNAVLLRCERVGADLSARVASYLEAFKADGVACVWLDLPLADPNLFIHGADLTGLGFAFCCVLPEVRSDGDVLRLQYLNGVDLHIAEIATSSDFGHALLIDIAAGFR
jgi:serine/threonine-protein kinase RsbW